MAGLLLNFILLVVLFKNILAESTVTVHYGDIRLDNDRDGLVLLYLGPDGADIESMWGTLSAMKQQSVPHTLCRQLGYIGGRIHSRHEGIDPANATVPLWLSNIDCNVQDSDHQPNHILRCNYIKHENSHSHDSDMYLTCDAKGGHRDETGRNLFDGEVVLFPVDTLLYPNNNISTSFGMVAIKCGKGGENWRYIDTNDPSLSSNVTDTLCREIGYTSAVPNSARTLGQYEAWGYSFKDINHVTASVQATDINCTTSYQCIQCCLGDVDLSNCPITNEPINNNYYRSAGIGFHDTALVIGCTFSDKTISEGHRALCEIKTGSQANCSAAGPTGRTNSFDISLGVLLPVVVISIVISFLITFLVTRYYTKRKYVNEDHIHLDPQGGPSPPN